MMYNNSLKLKSLDPLYIRYLIFENKMSSEFVRELSIMTFLVQTLAESSLNSYISKYFVGK